MLHRDLPAIPVAPLVQGSGRQSLYYPARLTMHSRPIRTRTGTTCFQRCPRCGLPNLASKHPTSARLAPRVGCDSRPWPRPARFAIPPSLRARVHTRGHFRTLQWLRHRNSFPAPCEFFCSATTRRGDKTAGSPPQSEINSRMDLAAAHVQVHGRSQPRAADRTSRSTPIPATKPRAGTTPPSPALATANSRSTAPRDSVSIVVAIPSNGHAIPS